MPPKRTSTSETPAITLAAIRQLINDGISSALKAQAASMASASNPNKNTGITPHHPDTSGTPSGKKKEFKRSQKKLKSEENTTTNKQLSQNKQQ
ncbi:hypothetical protein Tco_0813317 [Tanacetum coccineum]